MIDDARPSTFGDTLSTESAPDLCRLTALQELDLRCSGQPVHAAALSRLCSLRRLRITSPLTARDGEPTLVVLTALTNLQELAMAHLHPEHPAAVTAEDFAAVTASQQLTSMHFVWNSLPDPEQVCMMFPRQRVRPNLVSLEGDQTLLPGADPLNSIASCCPNLQRLTVPCTGGLFEEPPVAAWWAGFAALQQLSGLTYHLNVLHIEMTVDLWQSLAALTGLQDLAAMDMGQDDMLGMVQLTSCTALHQLHVCSYVDTDTPEIYIENKVCVCRCACVHGKTLWCA